MIDPQPMETWDLWYPGAAATGLPFARGRLDPTDVLWVHSAPKKLDVTVRRFDVMVGKHGDHIGGELEAFKCLAAGEADASALVDLNWQTWT